MKKAIKKVEKVEVKNNVKNKKVESLSKIENKNVKPVIKKDEPKKSTKTVKSIKKNDDKNVNVKSTVNNTKVEKTKTEKYTKIKITEFVRNLKDEFKQYKNVEKLKVVDQFEDKLPKMKADEDYFICENQNGNLVIKSGFMLEYGYKKLSKGFFVPQNNEKVFALKTSKNIIFSDSFGSATKLKAGDYVVIQNKDITGMKKSEFEQNYVLLNKANKIIKSYEEELTK